MLAIGLGSQLSHELWDIDAEFVRRRILASVIAVAAIEAEVCEVHKIGFSEHAALLHRREHRAVALAVAAGIADHHLSPSLIRSGTGMTRRLRSGNSAKHRTD